MSNEQLAINNEMKAEGNILYSLIPLDDFKTVLGGDDRDDKLAKFCLVTSTLTIENYCKRKLLRKKHFERIGYIGDLLLPLREYPVSEVLGVFVVNPLPCGFTTMEFATQTPPKAMETPPSMAGEIIEPDFYNVIPDCGTDCDIPFSIELSPAVARLRCKTFKFIYWAGYSNENVPADLAAACLELASWNMSRYKGRRVGMTGNIKGAGVQGEHFEMSIPENVRILLEPYKRRVI